MVAGLAAQMLCREVERDEAPESDDDWVRRPAQRRGGGEGRGAPMRTRWNRFPGIPGCMTCMCACNAVQS
eukprot:gene14954-biopygen6649